MPKFYCEEYAGLSVTIEPPDGTWIQGRGFVQTSPHREARFDNHWYATRDEKEIAVLRAMPKIVEVPDSTEVTGEGFVNKREWATKEEAMKMGVPEDTLFVISRGTRSGPGKVAVHKRGNTKYYSVKDLATFLDGEAPEKE